MKKRETHGQIEIVREKERKRQTELERERQRVLGRGERETHNNKTIKYHLNNSILTK